MARGGLPIRKQESNNNQSEGAVKNIRNRLRKTIMLACSALSIGVTVRHAVSGMVDGIMKAGHTVIGNHVAGAVN